MISQCHVFPVKYLFLLILGRTRTLQIHLPVFLFPCFPHLCLCSSSSPYSSSPNPSAPGSIPRFYFVYIWTGTNKGKSNIKLAVCSKMNTEVWKCVIVPFHLILNRRKTYQCCTASSQKLYIVGRHGSSFAVSKKYLQVDGFNFIQYKRTTSLLTVRKPPNPCQICLKIKNINIYLFSQQCNVKFYNTHTYIYRHICIYFSFRIQCKDKFSCKCIEKKMHP